MLGRSRFRLSVAGHQDDGHIGSGFADFGNDGLPIYIGHCPVYHRTIEHGQGILYHIDRFQTAGRRDDLEVRPFQHGHRQPANQLVILHYQQALLSSANQRAFGNVSA